MVFKFNFIYGVFYLKEIWRRSVVGKVDRRGCFRLKCKVGYEVVIFWGCFCSFIKILRG